MSSQTAAKAQIGSHDLGGNGDGDGDGNGNGNDDDFGDGGDDRHLLGEGRKMITYFLG